MASRRCEVCGEEEYMPYECKFCGGRYCARHRLPENHRCTGLAAYKERVRAEGRLMAPEPDLVAPRVSAGARVGATWSAFLDRVFDLLDGRAAYTFLGIIIGVYLLEFAVEAVAPALFAPLFVLGPRFYLTPWTLVTSIFAHAPPPNFYHVFVNALVLYFFGPLLEQVIGTRRFTWLFLGSGVLAGLVQVVVFSYILGVPADVLGASGALMAIMGALALLAPRLTVYVFFLVPLPLWLATSAFALYDLLLAVDPSSRVAHLAHLTGLAIGLLFAKRLHDRGLRVHVGPPAQRRWREYF